MSHTIRIEALQNLIFSIMSKMFRIFHETSTGLTHSYSLGELVEKRMRTNGTNTGTRMGNRDALS